MAFCLVPKVVDDFIAKLKNGTIDPLKMAEMSSDERRAFLAEHVGEANAKEVNALFESKLLLKNQQKGMITWIKQVAGLKPDVRRNLITKVEKLGEVLTPENQKAFLQDLVEHKLGVAVNADEAKKIAELSQKIQDLQQAGKDIGTARVTLENYVGGLSHEKFKPSDVLAFQRATQTAYDISAAGKQASPYIYTKEWRQAFNPKTIASYLKKDGVDALKARIYDNKYWADAERLKNELGLTMFGAQREETFFSKKISNLTGLSAAERIYDAPLNDLRFHRFANTLAAYEKAGVPLGKEEQAQLAKVIAAATGRGEINPALGNSLSTGLFSPRWLKSRLDVVLNVATKKGPARKEAAKALAALAGTSVATISLFKLGHKMNPAIPDVELDPRSADAYKVKIGNTRIDLTFGFGGIVRLLAQIGTNSTKTAAGNVVPLNSDVYGAQTSQDVIANFLRGKASPITSLIADFISRSDFDKNKLGIDWHNLKGEKNVNDLKRIASMFEPLLASDVISAYKDASGQTNDFIPTQKPTAGAVGRAALAGAASFTGIGVNTYGNGQAKIEKDLGISSNNADFRPLLQKMVKEHITVTLPTSQTTIQKSKNESSRPMTPDELVHYQAIYARNLKKNLNKYQSILLRDKPDTLKSDVDKIKTNTTKESKDELLKGMIK